MGVDSPHPRVAAMIGGTSSDYWKLGSGMWRVIATIVLLTGVIRANDALADWFYPALQIKCKEAENKLSILNVSAYNEAGIKEPSESEGIYVPENWPMQKERYMEKTTRAN